MQAMRASLAHADNSTAAFASIRARARAGCRIGAIRAPLHGSARLTRRATRPYKRTHTSPDGRPAVRHLLFALALTLAAAAVLPAATVSAAPTGDVNNDCIVNSTDLMMISSAYGYSYGSLRYKPQYDLNGDRHINVIDIQIAASNFGASC
jgi:hypothetical protein